MSFQCAENTKNELFFIENYRIVSMEIVLSRPSSPAASASRHSSSVMNRSSHHGQAQQTAQQQQQSQQQQSNQSQPSQQTPSTPSKQSQNQQSTQHDVINYEQQPSPAHHRANSGPTIAISLFPEAENSNCKFFEASNGSVNQVCGREIRRKSD